MTKPITNSTKRSRRSSKEIRQLLIDAAESVFSQNGYSNSTVEQIFSEAGGTRSALYRHFNGKPDLFRHAVLRPFLEFLQTFTKTWESQVESDWDGDFLMSELLGTMYDSFEHHGATLLSIIQAMDNLETSAKEELYRELQLFFDEMLVICEREAKRGGWIPLEGLDMSMRISFGSVAAMTLLSDIFLPSGTNRPSRENIIQHLGALIFYGLRLQPPHNM